MLLDRESIKSIIADGEYELYGLRYDRSGIADHEIFENSHEWCQDCPDQCQEKGIDDPSYNPVLGCWDCGELPGVSTIWIHEITVDVSLDMVQMYKSDLQSVLYLVGGHAGQGGTDVGEIIIYDGECLGIVKER